MVDLPHSIRAQTLTVDVASEATALALQPRLGDLNRRRLVPVIERVLGEFDVRRRVRIDRLAVELGALPLHGFEDAAEAALYDALRRALESAIDGEEVAGGAPAAERTEERALIELLEHYLHRGTLPFWAATAGMPRADFSATDLVQTLASRHPAELATLIRRSGRDRHALERLVLQLDEATLQTVLRLVEPAHAALILAYLLDLRQIHRTEPLLALGETAFARLLWVLALSYLLREAGSQFNRKSFVRSLLEGLARSGALDFRALVATLAHGLRVTLRHQPLASSLPAVIGEIVRDLDIETTTVEPAGGPADADPSEFALLVRRHASDRRMLERLVAQLDEATLRAVLRLLEPTHAALIVAYMIELRQIHRVAPLLALGEAAFERLLWVLALSYVAREAGSQFNRISFVRALLEGMARSEALDYAALVATLARGLRAAARHRPLVSSLPAVIGEIVRDVDLVGAALGEHAAPDADLADVDPSELAALVRRRAGDRRMLERLVARLDETALQTLLRALEPAHAALIIAYMLDLGRLHSVAPVLPLGEAAFGRLVWVLVLSYLAREAGSQFNRKSFVRALLVGLARSEGIDENELMATLGKALRVTAERRPLASSLPAVIAELTQEAPRDFPAVTEEADRVLDRYDRRDALRHYLRHGVLPLDVLLRRPDLRAEELFADLSTLGRAQLRDLFAAPSAEARWAALLRAVRAMPRETTAALVLRLIPHAAAPDHPLRAALATFAAQARDRDAFHARVIAALLDGDALDLEAMAAGPLSPPLSDLSADPSTWPAPRLKAALLAGLREDGGAEPDWTRMFDALLTRDPADARHFLHAAGGSTERNALLARLSPPLFARSLALTHPAHAPALTFLAAAMAELPIAERPGSAAAVRQAILAEALRMPPGAATEELFARVLRAVFRGTLSALAAERLTEALARAAVDETSRAALASALAAAGEASAAQTTTSENPVTAWREALFAWLGGEETDQILSPEFLLAALPEIIAAFPDEIERFVARHVIRPDVRARWGERLPDSALARLVHVLEPRQFRFLIDAAELLHEAAATAPTSGGAPPSRAVLWETVLGYLAATPAAHRSLDGLVAAVLARSADHAGRLRDAATQLAREAGRPGLVAALRAEAPGQRRRERPLGGKTAFGLEAEAARGEPIYLDNAGLVLAGAFLPHLFRTLDMLAPDERGRSRMRDHDTASRAVHLLQYLVDGRFGAPEPLLVLNKILCGLPIEVPVAREIVPSERERELCDDLLVAMIARWEIIRNSSVAALRETFLQREGRLERGEDRWELRVDRKTVDVLVDRVPWSIAVVYHSWMPQPLHVTW